MEHPKRKHPRFKNFDYSSYGYYYVTICTHQRQPILSNIVGRGLAPAADECIIELTPIGSVVKHQLLDLENRYPYLIIDRYVIMPDHIHMILVLLDLPRAAGASPRPTKTPLTGIIGAFKSIVTRICNEKDDIPGRKIFQTSFYEHIIRNAKTYEEICIYMYENPMKWYHNKDLQEV